ncbi:hypothetical protein [Flammeovirga agarivorans]|uniref:Uncharacterized protein n=1 Tax=Flammeovirga agarivorans TaxID=2726742 RepID=A0A7X8XYM3_9BACT|nr:hypothetical protein [Flammeovirga agarivorans]NLR94263.1 hypothetical protein [Flammeovirga agarivorans]
MQQFFKEKTPYIIIITSILLGGCSFFGLDKELKDLTINDLLITTASEIYIPSLADEWTEGNPVLYSDTRDSVIQKNFIDINQIRNGSFSRIQISAIYPADSTLYILDSVDVYLEDLHDKKVKIGYLYDITTTSTPKTLDMDLESAPSGLIGEIFRSDTVIITSRFHLRNNVRTDTMTFNVEATYQLTN